jgi:FKBP-type peptidyl-prolyl cis-trans isomerase SlyD
VVVKDVDEENVTVDANHPLAGQVLNFDVSIDSVRAASEEELAHGHVH